MQSVFSHIKRYMVWYILGLALATRLGLLALSFLGFQLPDNSADTIDFNAIALHFTDWYRGIGENPFFDMAISARYPMIIGAIYYVFGVHSIYPLLLNVLLGVGIVWCVIRTTQELSNDTRIVAAVGIAAALFPTMNLYSVVLLREAIMVFPLALSFLYFVRWMKNEKTANAVWMMVFGFTAALFHRGMLAFVVVYAFMLLFYCPSLSRFRIIPKLAAVLIFIISAGLYWITTPVPIPGIGQPHARPAQVVTENGTVVTPSGPSVVVDVVSVTSTHLEAVTREGRTSYLQSHRPDKIIDIISQTPIRVVYFFFAPFPWDIHEAKDVVGVLDAFLYFVLCVGAVIGVWKMRKSHRAFAIALVAIFILFTGMFAWGTSNYGSAIRHRQKITFALVTIAAVGYGSVLLKKRSYENQ